MLLILRGILPALFAIAMGVLVGAIQAGTDLVAPLVLMGVVFVLLQVLAPLHQAIGANLGYQTAAWLYDQLTVSCVAPPGMAHLEDPELAKDITMARDFDLGISGPPLSISMDFIASALSSCSPASLPQWCWRAYAWWAPLLLGGAWLATHWAVARERRMEGSPNGCGTRRPAPRGLRLSAGRRCAFCEGTAAVWPLGLDRRAVSASSSAAARSALAGHETARAPDGGKRRRGDGGECHSVHGARGGRERRRLVFGADGGVRDGPRSAPA